MDSRGRNQNGHSSKLPLSTYLIEMTEHGPGKKHVLLGSKATIGRNVAAEIPLNSTIVSRNHAILEHSDSMGWSITDNKSINGVYVEQQQLKPLIPFPLRNSVMISLGPPNLAKHKFMFYTNSKRKKAKPMNSCDGNSSLDPCKVGEGIPGCSKSFESPMRRVTRQSTQKRSVGQDVCNTLAKRSCPSVEKRLTLQEQLQAVDDMLKRNDAIDRRVKQMIDQSEERLSLSMADSSSQESSSLLRRISADELSDSFSECSTQVFRNISPNKRKLDTRSCNQDNIVRETSCGKESLTKEEVMSLKERVLALEKELQKEEQAKIELQNQLKEKAALLEEKPLQKKEREETQPKKALHDTEELQQTVNAEVANQFGKIMETELTCSICTEWFIKATTLECAHTFCADCLEKWKKTRKICPICRTPISSATHALVIDSFIDKLVEKLSPEDQEKRKLVVEERLASSKTQRRGKKKKRAKCSTTRTSRSSRARLASPDDDDDDEITWSEAPRVSLSETFLNAIINGASLLGSSDSEDSLVEGFGYYGGYGRCYNCGRSGHWQNGCPDL